MESLKKSMLENIHPNLLSYCLDFLETFELCYLKRLNNKFLLKIIYKKKLPEGLEEILKNTRRCSQQFDFPPDCFQKDHEKNSIISRFCQVCCIFTCDSCFEKCKNKNKKISFYHCKNKKHKGHTTNIDKTCHKCISILCNECINNRKTGNLMEIKNLKEFCKIKEKEKIDSLRTLAYNYREFGKNLDIFIEDIFNSIKSNYTKEFQRYPHLKRSQDKIKEELKDEIEMKLKNICALIILKIYDSYSVKEVDLMIRKYKVNTYTKLKNEIDYNLIIQKINELKIGENYRHDIEIGHQYLVFVKLPKDKISEQINLIPTEGQSTSGLAGPHKGIIKCFACHKVSRITKFWHHESRSRYLLDYICEECQCSVCYNYDLSGPWN